MKYLVYTLITFKDLSSKSCQLVTLHQATVLEQLSGDIYWFEMFKLEATQGISNVVVSTFHMMDEQPEIKLETSEN